MEDQVRELEGFISIRLLPRLEEVEGLIKDVEAELAGYEALAGEMAMLQAAPPTVCDPDSPFMVVRKPVLEDIGLGIKVQAEYTNPAEVYVHVGLGFHAPLDGPQSSIVACERRKLLMRRLQGLEKDRDVVNTDIKDARALILQARSPGSAAMPARAS